MTRVPLSVMWPAATAAICSLLRRASGALWHFSGAAARNRSKDGTDNGLGRLDVDAMRRHW